MRYNLLILLVFVILTFALTYPLIFHMHEAVEDPGDSLFVSWTIAWDIKALLKDPLNIFHTNIFYPYKYTLAYSEHMIGVALLSLPIYFFINNPLFIYNSMLLLSFILCGWGAYLLTYHLTKDRLAGVIASIIFAFCPYRFDQFGHLHVLTSQWMPFTLLFLHKMIPSPHPSPQRGEGRVKWAIGFGFFFFLQFLSSGHNGMYLAIAVVLFMLYFKVFPWEVLLIAGIFILPFYYPYFYLAKEFGFIRPPYEFKLYSPQLSSYLAVPSKNWLYGKYLGKYCRAEAVMFPGILAIVFAFWGKIPKLKFRVNAKIINIFILIDILIIILVAITGGIDLGRSLFGIKLKVSDFTRPIYILLLLFGLKIITNWEKTKTRIKNIIKKVTANKGPAQFYWVLAIMAFILSFGPIIRTMDKDIIWGPYSLLYNFVPGFKGIRVSGRIYTLFILALAVLAGFGVKKLRAQMKKLYHLSWIIPFVVLIEYINIPIPLNCWVGTRPSPSYKWIANQSGDFVIMELPMPDWYDRFPHEIQYEYWSLYHGKKMINGYSGYFPPPYWVIGEKMKDFPNEDAIEMLKTLGVKYIIVHQAEIDAWGWPSVVEKMGNYKDIFNLRFRDGDDYIYELCPDVIPTLSRDKLSGHKSLFQGLTLNKKDGWSIGTNYNSEDIDKAIDNNPATRWHSGAPQTPGMYVELDLGELQKICGISMYFGDAAMDYPRGLELDISTDRKHWQKVPLKFIYANYAKHLLKYPKDNRMILNFKPKEARFIRLTQTGNHDTLFWSIFELEVYVPCTFL